MKKTISFILALSLIITIFACLNITAFAFSPRLSAPEKSGWYAGYTRNNCVAYARCRANEILGYTVSWSSGDGGVGFWNTPGFSHGSTPKVGAIACWDNHVAIVESVSGSNIVLSEGHYSFQPTGVGKYENFKNIVINGGGGSAGTWFDNYYGTILSNGSPSECDDSYTWYGYVYLIDDAEPPTKEVYIFDVNVDVDGERFFWGHGSTTFDVFINGTLAADDVTEFCREFEEGTTYTVADIKVGEGYHFFGEESYYSGTVTAYTEIDLPVTTKEVYVFDVNVDVDGERFYWGHGSTTFDVYINGTLAADDVTEFCKVFEEGTTYTVADIKVCEGYHFFGEESYSGTVTAYTEIDLPVSKAKPIIRTQPVNVSAAAGATAKFSVTASGATSYQWQVSSDNGVTWKNSGASSAKTANLTVDVTASTVNELYRCAVSNANGTVYSDTVKIELSETVQFIDASRITLSWTSKAYNGEVQKPAVTVRNADNLRLTEGKSYTLGWSGDSKLPGSYTVTVTGMGEKYIGSVSKTYIIGKQPLDASRITLSWTSKAYNGEVQKPTVTVKNAAGLRLTEGTSYTLEWSGDSKLPGSYAVTVKGMGEKYSGSVSKTYTIGKQPLDASRVTLSWSSKAYSSSVQKPAVTVKNAAGNTLTEGTSYTVSYSAESKAPGTYTVTVTGKGSFSGSVTKEYTITKQTLAASRVTLSWTSKAYNTGVQKPAVTVKNAAGATLTEGTSYTVSYSAESKAPGAYTVTVTGKGRFSGSVTKEYTITKQALAASRVTLSWTSKVYNSSVQKPTVTVKNAAGATLTEGTSYTVSYSAESKAPGTYTVTVTGKGSFSGSVTKEYKITKQALAVSRVTLSWKSNAYNSGIQKPTVTVKNAAGATLTEGTSYTVSYSAESKAPGTYTVTVTGKGSFSGSVTKEYKITKQTLAASRVTLSWTSKACSGSVQKPTVTVKNAAGTKLTEGTSYIVSYSAESKDPGTYTVTVTGKGNYFTGIVEKTYTITK
ncbi:MAG: CHAP domain-containing protein [Clostridia bacterium]|nr:CHAP domain-containing protein [Clostridia bacterium]